MGGGGHKFILQADNMDLKAIVNVLQKIAPLNLAEKWDNVGLLVQPFSAQPIHQIVLTIDLTEAVLHEVLSIKVGSRLHQC